MHKNSILLTIPLFKPNSEWFVFSLGNNFANFYKSERRREQIDEKRKALEAKKRAGVITPFGQENLASLRLSVTELDGQPRGKLVDGSSKRKTSLMINIIFFL